MQRVLVVDDEPDVAKALRRTLRSSFEVRTVGSPEEALAILDEFQPDAVISDFRMPGMSGAELLAEVQRRVPGCVRLLLSGYTEHQSMMASLEKGLVARFLMKPWDNDALVLLVERLLAHPELRIPQEDVA